MGSSGDPPLLHTTTLTTDDDDDDAIQWPENTATIIQHAREMK